ncbi:hypothetical protein MRX96_005749 [Rhipicephalus microplus]
MKRSPTKHSPQEDKKPTTSASTLPSASETTAQRALQTHVGVPHTGDVGGSAHTGPLGREHPRIHYCWWR